MKKLVHTIFLLILFMMTNKSFPQLDSVYYLGPSQGSVQTGAIQTTDNFNDGVSSFNADTKIIPDLDRRSNYLGDFVFGWDESRLPDYTYNEDSHTKISVSGTASQTVLINSFAANPMTNYIPPDPAIAVGPEHIIVCANSIFRILDKSGNILKIISAAEWWAPAWPDENGDPQVIYDHYENRWVLVWMQVNSSNLTAGNLIAYSDDENPLGTWYMYRLDTKMHGTVPSNTWGDYPKVGFDEDALYIMTRCINFGAGFLYTKIRIINKSDLYSSNGGQLTYTDFWDIRTPGQGSAGNRLDCITPGISYSAGNGGWFFWSMGVYGGPQVSADFYALYKVVNPLTNPTIRGKVLPVQQYYSPPLANQLGGGLGIETIGWITKGPVIRDGFLYVAHDIQNSTNSSYSSVKYMKIDLSAHSIIDNIEFGSAGYFYLFPAITVDQDNNVAITFSRSADNEYIGAYYTTKLSTESAFIPSQPFKEGQANYVLTYGGNINRWGDYFGIQLDPANNLDVWMIGEYAASIDVWGTYVGQIRMVPYQGAHAFAQSFNIDFGNLELGSTPEIKLVTLSNYGTEDLLVSSVNTPTGPFTLVTSVPFTLAPYDSIDLEFEFDPTDAIVYDELMSFTNNDPGFPGFTMKGRGFEITEANQNVFYSISNATVPDTGMTLSLNKTTGVGTLLGGSNFSDIRAMTIDPKTNIIYGIIPGGTSSNLVRVNASGGDAYTMYTLTGLGFAIGVAFDTSGTLYAATQAGGIYSVDLSNGTTTQVITTAPQLTAIAFDPTTNELWATPRLIIGQKDKIFKINLMTGDTTNVGRTGFNVQTNDLTFDETGVLYGVIGGTTEIGKLISIDKTTAAGTEIGETGYTNVQSLAYRTGNVSSVDEDGKIPLTFSLQQNYPNPFNPSTSIEFSIPVSADIELVVYDILGQQVTTLINEHRSAGSYSVVWNADDSNSRKLSSGIYFYMLKASGVDGNDCSGNKEDGIAEVTKIIPNQSADRQACFRILVDKIRFRNEPVYRQSIQSINHNKISAW